MASLNSRRVFHIGIVVPKHVYGEKTSAKWAALQCEKMLKMHFYEEDRRTHEVIISNL